VKLVKLKSKNEIKKRIKLTRRNWSKKKDKSERLEN
jgi:hypothetical protein